MSLSELLREKNRRAGMLGPWVSLDEKLALLARFEAAVSEVGNAGRRLLAVIPDAVRNECIPPLGTALRELGYAEGYAGSYLRGVRSACPDERLSDPAVCRVLQSVLRACQSSAGHPQPADRACGAVPSTGRQEAHSWSQLNVTHTNATSGKGVK